MHKSYDDNIRGIGFMLLHALAAAILFASVKTLTKDINSSQVVFFYKFSLLLIILPWVFKDGLKSIYTKKIKTYLIGSLLGCSATLCLMHGLQYLPLANVTSLGYMEKILLSLIGIYYFKEKIILSKILATFISLIGAIIVIYPNINHGHFYGFDHHYCFIFVSIILWVSYCLTIKSLSKTEELKTQSFYTIFFSTLISIPVAFINWQQNGLELISWQSIGLELKHIPIILLMALSYFTISISAFKSFKYGELSIIAPFGYAKIIFSGLLGMILFNEYPAMHEYIGYVFIAISGWYIARKKAY